MFYSYNYFRQHNNNEEITNHKEFYREFSNKREFGGDFTNYDHLMQNRFHNTINHVYNAIIRKTPKNLLDIGCGNGVNLPLSRIFPFINYCAIDYAESAIASAKKDYPNVDFKVGDAFNLPYEQSTFDMAILSSVLIIYKNEDDRIALLQEVRRVLSDDGVLVLIVWNDTFMIRNCIKLATCIGKIKKENLPQDFMGCHFNRTDIYKMAKKSGFIITEQIKTSELFGILECVRYLNMSKFRRKFGKAESQCSVKHSQNIKADLIDQAGSMKWLTRLFLFISKLFPKAFSWMSIYLLTK